MPYANPEDRRANDRAKHPAKYAKRKATTKTCSKCSEPLWALGLCNTHYAERHRAEGGDAARSAQRRAHLKMVYGITEEDYAAMLAAQGNACAICRGTTTGSRRTRYFHVDHDHATNKVRGLLCAKCNTALGLMDDSVDRLIDAIDYLRRVVS